MDIRISTDQPGDLPLATTFEEFARANVDALDVAELADVQARLERGETAMNGGGAAPLFTIERA